MDEPQAVIRAFWLGVIVGTVVITLVTQFVLNLPRPHPRNNKQYTPPLNDEAPVVAHPPLNLLEGPTDDD